MSERYWVTGVQLGLLQQLQHDKARKDLVDLIVKNQFVGNKKDLEKMLKVHSVGFVCDDCGSETASCLTLCPDCDDRKLGALEELEKLQNSFISLNEETWIYLIKRIKKLEEGEKK